MYDTAGLTLLETTERTALLEFELAREERGESRLRHNRRHTGLRAEREDVSGAKSCEAPES